MPGSSHESLLKVPQVIKSVFSNGSSKSVASKIKTSTKASYRYVSSSQCKDSPEMTSGLIEIDSMVRPSTLETVGLWGERFMRGFLVGAPPLVLMQVLTGGSRPDETIEGSEWNAFGDNNGVSGHAFMSSLTFINAAKLSENPWRKTFWYAASAIGPLSRMNDNAHYPSQIGLGWAMAYIAATAVQQSDTGKRGWTLEPQSSLSSSGVALQYL